MDGALEVLEHVAAHLVAAHAERLAVRQLHGSVEATPEDYAGHETGKHQGAETEDCARPADDAPDFPGKIIKPSPPWRIRARRGLRGRAHRRFSGTDCSSTVSMS